MLPLEIIKEADYYHLLGDNLQAKKVIDGFESIGKWECKLKKSLKKFYLGMDKTSGNTQSLIEGVEEINGSIKKLDKLLDWGKFCNNVEDIKLKVEIPKRKDKYKDKYYIALESKLGKIKKQFNELQLQYQSNNPDRDSTDDILPFIIKEIAVVDLCNIKKKYWYRIKEFKKLKIRKEKGWLSNQEIEQEAEIEVKEIFESVGSDRNSNKYLKEAEAVFSLAILAAKGYLSGMDEMKDRYIEIMSYIRRGFALYLQGKYRQGFDDYTEAQYLILKPQYEQCEKDKKILGYLSIFINILKGDLYYDLYNNERAFDYYCDAMREWEKYKDKSDEVSKEIDKSYRIAEAMAKKSKIFFDKGKFRDSLIWSFLSLWILLNILKEEKSQGIDENIEKINGIISGLKETKDKYDIIQKKDLGELLKLISPCSVINPLKKRFAMLSSIAFNQIGFTGYTLKLDYLKILPECAEQCKKLADFEAMSKKEIIYHYLYTAYELDPGYGFAVYDMGLYLFRHEENSKMKELRDRLANSTWVRDNLERKFAIYVLMKKLSKLQGEKRDLLRQFITDIDKFIIIPREINRYIDKRRVIGEEEVDRFIILRRWSSYTPRVPRPRISQVKGGGYFLIWKGKGIVIDPGFDFLINLYNEGFSISDIDAIIVTHPHIDHMDDLIATLILIFEQKLIRSNIKVTEEEIKEIEKRINKDEGGKKEKAIRKIVGEGIDLFLSPGTFQNFNRWISAQEEVSAKAHSTASVHPLTPDAILNLKDSYKMEIETIKAEHDPLKRIGEYPIGIILRLYDDDGEEPLFNIGITGDTAWYEDIKERYQNCDILVAHLGHARFMDVAKTLGVEFTEKEDKGLLDLIEDTPEVRELLFALGCKLQPNISGIEHNFLIGEVTSRNHLRWSGVTKIFESFSKTSSEEEKLFIISEFGEEQKSYRNKFAFYLNRVKEESQKIKCLTGDIGLQIGLNVEEGKKIMIQCTKCRQDNNLDLKDTFYEPNDIKEICIKQDDEGMVYYCKYHDSKSEKFENRDEKIEFIEKVERFWAI